MSTSTATNIVKVWKIRKERIIMKVFGVEDKKKEVIILRREEGFFGRGGPAKVNYRVDSLRSLTGKERLVILCLFQ